MSLDHLGQVLARSQPAALAMLVVAVLGSLLTRAARWQVTFLPQRRVPYGPLFGTLAISYMASTFLPFRAGELVRALFLGQRQSLAVPRIVGTILLEKLFDFLAIGVMLLLVLTTPLPPEAKIAGSSIVAVIVLGFGGVVALALWRVPTLRVVDFIEQRLPFGLGRRVGLGRAVRQFAEGTDSLRSGRLWLQLLAWTGVTWLFALFSGWAGTRAVGVEASVTALLLLTVLTSAGQSVPSSPGYVGVYHFFAQLALRWSGVDAERALGAAVLTHALSYGPLVVVGLIAMWTGGYSFGDLLAGLRRPSTTSVAPSPILAPDS